MMITIGGDVLTLHCSRCMSATIMAYSFAALFVAAFTRGWDIDRLECPACRKAMGE